MQPASVEIKVGGSYRRGRKKMLARFKDFAVEAVESH
jgi:hypothetical protein